MRSRTMGAENNSRTRFKVSLAMTGRLPAIPRQRPHVAIGTASNGPAAWDAVAVAGDTYVPTALPHPFIGPYAIWWASAERHPYRSELRTR